MRVGLYFGTFNPIHVGHLIIANAMADLDELDQVWLVVTPQNPLKHANNLLEDYHRLALVKVAIDDNIRLRACDIEFNLPKPSYTVDTLAYLREKYPKYDFALIMGEDNLRSFQRWKNYEFILEKHRIYVYPRPITIAELQNQVKSTEMAIVNAPNVVITDAPVMQLSSTVIRNRIKQGQSIQYLVTDPVLNYIDEMNFYK
jgi:nicotinate-nucleotide adenylyltransferase